MSWVATAQIERSDLQQALLDSTHTPAPKTWHWAVAASLAVTAHIIGALPFLPEVEPLPETLEQPIDEIGINLAPIVQPPEVEAPPPPPPEPIEEVPVLQERATNSPPPAPPAIPRELPDLPDIRPQAIPELWMGSGGGGGSMSLEQYLFLREWLAGARAEVLRHVVYPQDAARLRITGSAEVIIIAQADGRIRDWSFSRQSNHAVLNRAVTRAIARVRRLPEFPEGTTHETLSYKLEFRFELMLEDGTIVAEADTVEAARAVAAEAAAEAARPNAPLSQLVSCASRAATLIPQRDAIMARRPQLEAMRDEYEREVVRYERLRRDLPRRVERLLDELNEGVENYDRDVTAFQAEAAQYSAQCGNIQTSFETFARACTPYRGSNNAFCEAFGSYWGRLNTP